MMKFTIDGLWESVTGYFDPETETIQVECCPDGGEILRVGILRKEPTQ